MEENFEEDWQILRRKNVDRIPVTMNVGEALSRLTLSVRAFLTIEGDTDQNFVFGIDHQSRKDSYTKLNYRVALLGFKDKDNLELFKSVNNLPFAEELEEAVENCFNEVRRVLLKFNQERTAVVEAEQDHLRESKETLMKLERNLLSMGLYDARQQPLPFTEEEAPESIPF